MCITVSNVIPSPHTKRDLDQFSRFCGVRDRDRQTDRQTTLPSVSI